MENSNCFEGMPEVFPAVPGGQTASRTLPIKHGGQLNKSRPAPRAGFQTGRMTADMTTMLSNLF
jgi:hypothetical protein